MLTILVLCHKVPVAWPHLTHVICILDAAVLALDIDEIFLGEAFLQIVGTLVCDSLHTDLVFREEIFIFLLLLLFVFLTLALYVIAKEWHE